MKKTVAKLLLNKHLTMPILTFPSVQLIECTVQDIVTSSSLQAKGMQAIADKCPMSATLHMMDLSVEAEAFGATVHFERDDIPTITKGVIDDIEESEGIIVPEVGAGRTGLFIEGVSKAKELLPDKLVLCGVIGPYSLAGRLFDMTELMMMCYDEPECVEILLDKTTEFLIKYLKAFKAAGADGVIMAEPAAGLLSPNLCAEFSSRYVKRIFAAVQSEDFILVYHNCGNVIPLADSILSVGADCYHFGNAIDMSELLGVYKTDAVIMGNINPVDFRTGNPEQIRQDTLALLDKCARHDNFIISSGCDIPADSKWENIDAYFEAVQEFYGKQGA